MINIPIILVHRGNQFYLKPVLEQAHAFNKDSQIYLIGDNSNNKYDFVEHALIADYFTGAFEFEKLYRHMSPNSWDYELFCFQRWFIIKEFVETNNIDNFLYIDSDLLLFCNVSATFSKYINYDFTTCDGHCPNLTLFNASKLNKFCSFITQMYSKSIYIDSLWIKYVEMKRNNGIEGNSDMTAFEYYQTYISNNVKELTDVNENGESFDNAINDGGSYRKNKKGQKKIYWDKNRPYCIKEHSGEKVYFLALHFQGNAKFDIFDYILDKDNKRGVFFRVKTILSFGYLYRKYRKYRFNKKMMKRKR